MDGTLLYSPVVTKSNLRGTGFISPYSSKTLFSTDGSWNRNSRQELEAETTEECSILVSYFCSANFLTQSRTTHPGLLLFLVALKHNC